MASLLKTFVSTLQPHREVVAATAGILTVLSFFSGSLVCWDMKKKGASDKFPMMPFLGGFVMSVLNLKYGTLIRDDTVIRVNFFGLGLNIIYILCYYNYARSKGTVWSKIGLTGALSAAVIAYSQMEDPTLIEKRLGVIITVFFFGLIGSPLLSLGEIIRTKSTEGLPFPIIASTAVVTFLWLMYGLIIEDIFMIFQNCVAFTMSAFQLALFAIYPSSQPETRPSKQKTKKIN